MYCSNKLPLYNEQLKGVDRIQSQRVVMDNVHSRKSHSVFRPWPHNINYHHYSSSLTILSNRHQWLLPFEEVLIACSVRICSQCGAFCSCRPGLQRPPLSWTVSPSWLITFRLDWITRQMSRVRSQNGSVWCFFWASSTVTKGKSCWWSVTWNQKIRVHILTQELQRTLIKATF